MAKTKIDSCKTTPIVFSVCEFIGSIFLVIAAVAPIILVKNILSAPIYIAVVADALAVGFVLFALIEIFGPICTAYFNPAVCLAMALNKDLAWSAALKHSIAQVLGGLTGILFVHLMFYDFRQIFFEVSEVTRSSGTIFAEALGTFILVLCILSLVHQNSDRVSLVVGLLVGGMLLSTSSTMFANPQVTIARMFTYSDAGIRPFDGLIFIIIQFIAAAIAFVVWKYSIKKCAQRCG